MCCLDILSLIPYDLWILVRGLASWESRFYIQMGNQEGNSKEFARSLTRYANPLDLPAWIGIEANVKESL